MNQQLERNRERETGRKRETAGVCVQSVRQPLPKGREEHARDLRSLKTREKASRIATQDRERELKRAMVDGRKEMVSLTITCRTARR